MRQLRGGGRQTIVVGMMKHSLVLLSFAVALSGCAAMDRLSGKPPAAKDPALATEFAPAVQTTPLGGSGQSAASLDTTSAAEKSAALAVKPTGGERTLGQSVVALGPPAEQGLWVQSELVTAAGKGRVVAPNGKSLAVDLRPGSGGALMSLGAYQALGIGLTELPKITIYGP